MSPEKALTADERKLRGRVAGASAQEFGAQDADGAIATMVAHPRVNAVPTTMGGEGKECVSSMPHTLPQIPPDLEMVTVSRTIGQGRLVEEMIARFTHTVPMNWMLPAVVPTGKRVEIALLVV